jgi:hypothetical protein
LLEIYHRLTTTSHIGTHLESLLSLTPVLNLG